MTTGSPPKWQIEKSKAEALRRANDHHLAKEERDAAYEEVAALEAQLDPELVNRSVRTTPATPLEEAENAKIAAESAARTAKERQAEVAAANAAEEAGDVVRARWIREGLASFDRDQAEAAETERKSAEAYSKVGITADLGPMRVV